MSPVWYGILLWLMVLNGMGLITMALDKYKARRGIWRIPERTIWLLAILGGSLGAWLGMRLFRHKTRHRQFAVGLPLLFGLHLALLVWLAVQLA